MPGLTTPSRNTERDASIEDTAAHRSPPRVWVLLGKGAGGNGQMTSLAEALGWPWEPRQLAHNWLEACPNILLGASAATVDLDRSDPLVPPWPDLVIAASRRSAPVARWIKRQSQNRTRLVHLLHAQMPLDGFDLVITLPQYRLPRLPNVLHNIGPLNHIDTGAIDAAGARFAPRLETLPRPWIALNVGGNSSSYRLTPEVGAQLGREASAAVGKGSLLVCTSPRTPEDATEALFQAISCPAYLYSFKKDDPENPYRAFLGLADRFIVTVDSASLAVEACATGKPVQVFEWARRGAVTAPSRRILGDKGYERLIYTGLIKPPRDFDAFHAELRTRGLTTRFGTGEEPPPGRPLDDMERAVERIRDLFYGSQSQLTASSHTSD